MTNPDRAEAVKNTQESAAYDEWFGAQIQASLDDPRPSIPHKEVRSKCAAHRQALRSRLENLNGSCFKQAIGRIRRQWHSSEQKDLADRVTNLWFFGQSPYFFYLLRNLNHSRYV